MMAIGDPDMEPLDKKMRHIEAMLRFDNRETGDFRTRDQVKTFFNS